MTLCNNGESPAEITENSNVRVCGRLMNLGY